MKQRQEKQAAAFINEGFTYAGIEYRPLTAKTLLILERVKSPFSTGEGSQTQALLDYLFAVSRPDAATLSRDPEAWSDAIFDFADNFSAEDLNALGELIAQGNEELAAAVVEVREDNAKKKRATSRTGAPT